MANRRGATGNNPNNFIESIFRTHEERLKEAYSKPEITKVMSKSGGNEQWAAKQLGVGVKDLRTLLDSYNLSLDKYQ